MTKKQLSVALGALCTAGMAVVTTAVAPFDYGFQVTLSLMGGALGAMWAFRSG